MATTVRFLSPQDGPLTNLPIDVLASNVHKAFPRGFAISDLDLKDDRYPTLSPRQNLLHSNRDPSSSRQSFYPDTLQHLAGPSTPAVHPQSQSIPDASVPVRAQDYPEDCFGAPRPQEAVQLTRADEQAYQQAPADRQYSSPSDINESSILNGYLSNSPQTGRAQRGQEAIADEPSYQQGPAEPRYPNALNESPTSNNFPSSSPSPQRANEQYSATDGFQLFSSSLASSGDANRPQPAGDSRSVQDSPQRATWQGPSADARPESYSTPQATPQTPTLSPSPTLDPMSRPQSYPSPIPIPVSSNLRAPAQQPTYITPPVAQQAMNPVFSTPAPGEEVCVECAMRDQDMADVDVTSPGIWSRESDVHYEELVRRELEEMELGVPPTENRPRARGGRLSEGNMKLWLSLNPKEASSKRNALENYIKSQRSLLEAEALARARAMQEARQIDDRMRDTYSQLRRSAYDLGSSAAPADDSGGVRIKAIRSPTVPHSATVNTHGREITLLENGMIVEHVDVRKEEREERERRRREEKRARARKSSRGSAIDVSSMYSSTSPLPHTDSGFHLGVSNSRYSTSRPMSVLTAPMDYPSRGMPHAHSTASVEAQSMISASASPNRRTRFFGLRNFSTGFRSSDSLAPSGFSGSMVDMHVALQRENARNTQPLADSGMAPPPITGWRNSTALVPQRALEEPVDEKPKKKKKGLAKIWRLVTGSSKSDSVATAASNSTRSLDRGPDDDYPLAPPPPISYLVNRSTGEHGGNAPRHVSTPSLPSSASPNYALSSAGVSPPTAPSSLLPSPTSSRPVGPPEDRDSRKTSGHTEYEVDHPSPVQEEPSQAPNQRNVHPVTSEPDMRRPSQLSHGPVPPVPHIVPATISGRPESIAWREKSLPPLPGDVAARYPNHPQLEPRPRTLFSYDMRQMQLGDHPEQLAAPQAPFRQGEARRQSFGGISTRPNLLIHTLPERRSGFGGYAIDEMHPSAEKYDQFGASRGSLGPLDGSKHNQMLRGPQAQTPSKRKSKFGIASLLGRKSPQPEREPTLLGVEFPVTRSSGSEAMHEAMMNEMGSSGSGHAFPRMSLSARKNIEELVDQSPDFVAYRYPSNDQNLDLLR